MLEETHLIKIKNFMMDIYIEFQKIKLKNVLNEYKKKLI